TGPVQALPPRFLPAVRRRDVVNHMKRFTPQVRPAPFEPGRGGAPRVPNRSPRRRDVGNTVTALPVPLISTAPFPIERLDVAKALEVRAHHRGHVIRVSVRQ